MGFTATKPASNYTPPPAGMHIGRCYRLIDLGTQPKTYQGQDKGEARKVMVSWELLGEDRMDDGKTFVISKSYFLSMHEKAALRKDLESWRGKPFTPEEESSFDVSKLLGAYCMLNVIQEKGDDGNEYTKISAVTPLMKGLQKPPAVNENILFDADAPDMHLFETFSDKMKEIISKSKEWRAKANGQALGFTAAKSAAEMDDDVPWN